MIFIVGATGLIGQALCREADRSGQPWAGTAPEPDAPWPLDLRDPPDSWRLPEPVSQAILCASIAGLAACERDPAGTRAVNVDAVIALADRVLARGAQVAFLSSTQVFPPEADAPDESHRPAPVTEYGRQKFAVERHLLEHLPRARVIRLTKVIAPSVPLFADWAASLAAGRPVQAYADLYFSPLALPVAASAILQLAAVPSGGVFHLGASDSISYLEAARWLARRLDADPDLVRPTPAPSPNTPASGRLACDRTRRVIGFEPVPAQIHLAQAFPPCDGRRTAPGGMP